MPSLLLYALCDVLQEIKLRKMKPIRNMEERFGFIEVKFFIVN